MSSFINQRRANALPGLWHDYANLFPMLDAAGQDALRADVQQHGVREPVIQFEGRILDGRNRYMAARDLGLDFPVAEFDGNAAEALAYVLSTNLHRRHLTESQRAAVAAKLANMKRGGDRKSDQTANLQDDRASITQAQAAQMLNVSERSVATAKKVIENAAPELIHSVEKGDVSVSAAADVSGLPKEEQAAAVAEGPDAVKAKAREVREARTASPPPSQEKASRRSTGLTMEALEEENAALREEVATLKVKLEKSESERKRLKALTDNLQADDKDKVIRRLCGEIEHLKSKVYRESRAADQERNKAYKLKKRVDELEAMPIDMGAAA